MYDPLLRQVRACPQQVVQEARNWDADEILLDHWEGNENAAALFKSCGFIYRTRKMQFQQHQSGKTL